MADNELVIQAVEPFVDFGLAAGGGASDDDAGLVVDQDLVHGILVEKDGDVAHINGLLIGFGIHDEQRQVREFGAGSLGNRPALDVETVCADLPMHVAGQDGYNV